MEVGDIVEPISSMYTLASGSEWYPWAVCISMEPFLLASQDGDWRLFLNPKAYSPENCRTMIRYLNGPERTIIKAVTKAVYEQLMPDDSRLVNGPAPKQS